MSERRRLDDQPLRQTIVRTLEIGVSAAFLLALVGLALALVHPVAPGAPLAPAWASWPADLAAGVPQAWLLLGLLVLVLTPLTRVALVTASYLAAGDRLFAALTASVLGIIGLTIVVGVTI